MTTFYVFYLNHSRFFRLKIRKLFFVSSKDFLYIFEYVFISFFYRFCCRMNWQDHINRISRILSFSSNINNPLIPFSISLLSYFFHFPRLIWRCCHRFCCAFSVALHNSIVFHIHVAHIGWLWKCCTEHGCRKDFHHLCNAGWMWVFSCVFIYSFSHFQAEYRLLEFHRIVRWFVWTVEKAEAVCISHWFLFLFSYLQFNKAFDVELACSIFRHLSIIFFFFFSFPQCWVHVRVTNVNNLRVNEMAHERIVLDVGVVCQWVTQKRKHKNKSWQDRVNKNDFSAFDFLFLFNQFIFDKNYKKKTSNLFYF